MAATLTIDNPEVLAAIARLAAKTGRDVDEVLLAALREEERRILPRRADEQAVRALAADMQQFPVLDDRNADEILYDDRGLFR